MRTNTPRKAFLLSLLVLCFDAMTTPAFAFWIVPTKTANFPSLTGLWSGPSSSQVSMSGSLHGQNACFLPIKQLDEEYYAPRIVQIAGAYPGLSREEYYAVQSEPAADPGQWTYDFSDPDGPQLGTVAVEGSAVVQYCEDPVVVIAEHTSMAIPFPDTIKDTVDLILLIDRSVKTYEERKFLVLEGSNGELEIAAFPRKEDLPPNASIIGRVVMCQVPWLPSMKKVRSGFEEEDELY